MKGFTLIELLTVAVIFALILAGTFAVLVIGNRSWQIGTTRTELQQEARRAMDVMVRELRAASAIDAGTFAGGVSNNIIRFTLEAQTVEYTVNGTQLLRNPTGISPVLANDVDSVQFHLFGGNVIHIILTTQETTNLGNVVEAVLNSQVVLRN